MIHIALSLFISGLLFGSGPCIASCGPILISYIAGTEKNIFGGLTFYILFSLARIFTYIILSLVIFFLGRFVLDRLLGGLSKYVLIMGGIFIIVIGLLVIMKPPGLNSGVPRGGILKRPLSILALKGKDFGRESIKQRLELNRNPVWLKNILQFLHKHILERDKKNMVILGLVMGLLPCAPFLAVLSYIGLVSETWISSLFYSLSFGLGTFVSPLILLTALAGLLPRFLVDKKAAYSRVFSFICGAIIVLLGIQLIIKAV